MRDSQKALLTLLTVLIFFPFAGFAQEGTSPNELAEAVSELSDRLEELERLDETLSVASQVRGVVITIIAVVSAITAILGFGIYSAIKSTFEGKIVEPAISSINEAVKVSKAETIAWSFNEFAYVWWVRYESELQKFLNGQDLSDEIKSDVLNSISNALHASRQGVQSVG